MYKISKVILYIDIQKIIQKGSWGQNLTIRPLTPQKGNPYLKSPSSNQGADSSVGLILVTKNKQDAILGKISIKISKRLIIKIQGIV